MKSFNPIFLFSLVLFFPGFAVAEESESWWQRDHLLDDWGGHRSFLKEHGIEYDIIYTGEFMANLDGGIQTGQDYMGDIGFHLQLNTNDAGWWDDGTFYVHLQNSHGRGITDRFVGDFQYLSNIDTEQMNQVSQFWYKHTFLDEKVWFKLGKMDSNDDFAFVDYGGNFINSSPGFSPTIPLVTFPDPDWGFVFGIAPIDWFSMNMGVYQGHPDGGRTIGQTLDNLYGPMGMIEPAFHYSIAGLPGTFRIGGWWNGDKFTHFDMHAPVTGEVDGNYGFYATFDQEIWKENQDQKEDTQGIGMFGQYGYTPADRSQAEHYAGAGLQWTGAIPSRDKDVMSMGVFHVDFSGEAGFNQSGETSIEFDYTYQALGWMSIKPVIQYIVNPGGMGNEDALVMGLRWEIVF